MTFGRRGQKRMLRRPKNCLSKCMNKNTLRLQSVCKKNRDGMLRVMFKLGQYVEKKWRRLKGLDYLTKGITGVKFKDELEVAEVDLIAA